MTTYTHSHSAAHSLPRRIMSVLPVLTICLLSAPCISSCNTGKTSGEFDYLYKDLPFEMPAVTRPQIPDRTVDLKDFGGNGNGIDLNTDAFAKAIDFLPYGGKKREDKDDKKPQNSQAVPSPAVVDSTPFPAPEEKTDDLPF